VVQAHGHGLGVAGVRDARARRVGRVEAIGAGRTDEQVGRTCHDDAVVAGSPVHGPADVRVVDLVVAVPELDLGAVERAAAEAAAGHGESAFAAQPGAGILDEHSTRHPADSHAVQLARLGADDQRARVLVTRAAVAAAVVLPDVDHRR
jgi:hypothetical protein